MNYLDTCIISTFVKRATEADPKIQSEMDAIDQLSVLTNPANYVMSPVAKKEFENDKHNDERRKEKLKLYEWFENVSVSSKSLNLIPVFNTDRARPMLPIHDPYDPPRPPGATSYAPERPKNAGPYLVGHNIFFTDKKLLRKLKVFFRGAADAEHVYQAIQAKCKYFVTIDQRTILNRVNRDLGRARELCGDLEFVSPMELLEIVRTSRASKDG